MAKNHEAISITLSKEVYDKLTIFRNRSKITDKILSYFLADLTSADIIEAVKIEAYEGSEKAAEYLIKKKCKEVKENKEEHKVEHKVEHKNEEHKKPDELKRKINVSEWWG